MTEFIKKFWSPIAVVVVVVIFFWQFFLKGLLPIPSDAIVGLYHPFLDLYAEISPAGVPFKNFLITDPVRQIIPWKELSINLLSGLELPLWNPYEMAGKPHLANFQSGVFYPLNLLLFIKPFYLSWSFLIVLQPVMSGIFLFFYLRNLKLDDKASLLGAISFAFGSFSIAWLEWGNIVHTALWLPLILLSVDKSIGIMKHESRIMDRKILIWSLVFLFSLVSSFFAGHLQIFFYVYVLSTSYFIFRWLEHGRKIPLLISYLILNTLFFILTSIQWVPTLQFIGLSARFVDQNPLTSDGWFIPLQHLIQFIAPDFFGNPSTLNYWGVWNYAELVGYVGIVSLFLAFCSILSKNKKETAFFIGVIVVSLAFALPTFIAKLPFDFSIPFLSSAQPTRLIFLITFALSVLSALGFNYLLLDKKINRKAVIIIGILFIATFSLSWLVALSEIDLKIAVENLSIAKRNLIFPSGILAIGLILLLGIMFVKETMARSLLILLVLALVSYDLYRFGAKFTPFTTPDYFYPQTRVIEFLLKDRDVFRIAAADSRILAPNFSTHYKIQSIEGYDPLYLLSYAELIAASEREDHSIHRPFGFNRIITPHNLDSPVIDFLNVKYVLSLSDLNSAKLTKVFQEGQTRVYENKNFLSRAFFVENVIAEQDKASTIKTMFEIDLKTTAVSDFGTQSAMSKGSAKIIDYQNNKIVIETDNNGDGFLVLSDSFYPTWRVSIDNKSQRIFRTNHAFRGVFVPEGKHRVVFYDTLF